MIVCPNCRHQEIAGALFCSECGAQLIETPRTSTQSIRPISTEHFKNEMLSTPIVEPPSLTDAAISLYVMDSGQFIPLLGRDEFTLGRSAEGQPILPDIDLTPFKAYENGVSRLHASIRITDTQVTVTDLGSVNGTRINNQKIPASKPLVIQHGDVVTLGKLRLQMVIRR
jgi:hypothetical protein